MSDTEVLDTEEQARQARTEQAMRDAGVVMDEQIQVDYFGFEETENVYLPDGKTYVTIQALNEGGRRRYLNKVNREVRIAKQSGDAVMQLANGDERRIILSEAIVGWNFVTRDRTGALVPVQYKESKLNEWLEKANPAVVDVIDKAVRKQNAWLLNDVTVEDLEKQIEELTEQLEQKRADEEGKES